MRLRQLLVLAGMVVVVIPGGAVPDEPGDRDGDETLKRRERMPRFNVETNAESPHLVSNWDKTPGREQKLLNRDLLRKERTSEVHPSSKIGSETSNRNLGKPGWWYDKYPATEKPDEKTSSWLKRGKEYKDIIKSAYKRGKKSPKNSVFKSGKKAKGGKRTGKNGKKGKKKSSKGHYAGENVLLKWYKKKEETQRHRRPKRPKGQVTGPNPNLTERSPTDATTENNLFTPAQTPAPSPILSQAPSPSTGSEVTTRNPIIPSPAPTMNLMNQDPAASPSPPAEPSSPAPPSPPPPSPPPPSPSPPPLLPPPPGTPPPTPEPAPATPAPTGSPTDLGGTDLDPRVPVTSPPATDGTAPQTSPPSPSPTIPVTTSPPTPVTTPPLPSTETASSPSPTTSTGPASTLAPSGYVLDPRIPVSSPTPTGPQQFTCQPTSGSCVSTYAELKGAVSALQENDVIALCGDGIPLLTQSVLILDEPGVTLCCVGTKKCALQSASGGRNLIITGSDVTLQDIIFLDGAPLLGDGGNVLIDANGFHFIANCDFKTGKSQGRGGNLVVKNAGSLLLRGCSFGDGYSELAGGGVAVLDTPSLMVEETVFHNNTAKAGGGLYVALNEDTIDGGVSQTISLQQQVVFSGNSARYGGGFLFKPLGSDPIVSVTSSIFMDNVVESEGAAGLIGDFNTADMLDLTLDSNTGSNNVGADFLCNGFSILVVAEDLCFSITDQV